MHGTYDDQANALRFERRLAHPIERVWRAVSTPEELRQWFPAAVELDLREGGAMTFTFPDASLDVMPGEVTAVDPPHLLEFVWGEETIRFELIADGAGTLLRFAHFLTRRDAAARDAAGWHVCLGRLETLLETGSAEPPGMDVTPEHRTLQDAYEERGLPTGAPLPGE